MFPEQRRQNMIRGYPARTSVAPGEVLRLHVATDSPHFRVRFLRYTGELVPMMETDWLPGKAAPERGAQEDWDWPVHEFSIPAHWPSCVCIAWLDDGSGAQPELAATSAAALFVVRGHGQHGLLYKLPFATYHAYNVCGGGCYYVNPPRSETPPGARVSLHRPGGGIGGDTWGALDDYDRSSPRQTFAHWDARFIAWLYKNGYTPEFCSDLDVHQDCGLLARYRLLVSVGHDEYWSEGTRNQVEEFVARGGNAAFFGANLCWWRIHYVDADSAMVCHQGGPRGALDHWWPATGANRPEDSLSGVSYRHGGGWWDGKRETMGYAVQEPDHWVFAGTGLGRGDVLGKASSPPLVGYECDGAPLSDFDPVTGVAILAPDAARYGTPDSYILLAASPLNDGWQERPPREGQAAHEGLHAATMGIFTRAGHGCVFSAGTTDWAQVLGSGQDHRVDVITANVIDALLLPASTSP